MGVIACAACEAAVNEEAAYCPTCGSDPRSGAPGPLTDRSIANDLNRRAQLAIGEAELSSASLPDPDHKRVRRLRLVVLVATVALLSGAGTLALLWWPSFLAARVIWDESVASPDGQWQERDVSFYDAGVTTDNPGRMWIQVRADRSQPWQSVYVGASGYVDWAHGAMLIKRPDPFGSDTSYAIASADPHHRLTIVFINPGETVLLLLGIVALGALLFAVSLASRQKPGEAPDAGSVGAP